MIKQRLQHTIIGLFICFGLGAFLAKALQKLFDFESFIHKGFLVLSCQVIVAVLVLLWVTKFENRKLTSISFIPFNASRDIKWGLIGFGLGGMSFALTGILVEKFNLGSTAEGIMFMGTLPIYLRVLIALTAGICEEIYLRAYPIERLNDHWNNIWLAAFVTVMIFMILHIPFWSLGGAIQIGIATAIWTLIYIKTRSIWAVIIMHVINDLFAFVLLPYLIS